MSGKQFGIMSLLAVLLLGAAGFVLWPRHGLRAEYFVGGARTGEPLHTRTDPGIWFRHPAVLNSVYTLKWKYGELPFPAEFPETAMRWTGFVEVPAGSPRHKVNLDEQRRPGLRARLWRGFGSLAAKPKASWIDTAPGFDWAHDQVKPAFPPFVIEWDGWLEVKTGGSHRFTTAADDGVMLYLDGRLVLDNCQPHEFTTAAAEVGLAPGPHRIRIRYFDLLNRAAMRLRWQPPGGEESALAGDALFHLDPDPAGYALALESAHEAWLVVGDRPPLHHPGGGRTVFTAELEPGVYPLLVELKRKVAEGGVVLHWKRPDGREEIVPGRAFTRSAADYGANAWHQAAAAVLGLLLAAGAAVCAWRRPRPVLRPLAAWWRAGVERRHGVALVAIVALGLALRLHQYDVLPPHGETVDEYNCAWSGWSLLHEGVPRGWSWFPAYGDLPITRWFGENYRLVKPLFEYPPLFSLVIGGAATLGGAGEMFACTLTWMRLPPLLFTSLGIWLLYLLGARLHGRPAALLGALLYACIPLVVVSGRLVKQENMMVPLTLGALLCLLRHFDGAGNGRWRDAAAVLAGLCALTKTTGLFLGVVLVLLLLSRRQWRGALRSGLICLACFAVYPLYGWWYDWELFRSVVDFMGSFTARLDAGMQFVRDGKLVVERFGDGWNLWLWLALAYAAAKEDKELSLTIIIYWLALAVSACGNAVYGWYRIPLYPLLCLCGGVYLRDLFQRPNLPRAAIFVLVCLAASGQYALPEHWTATFAFCRPALVLATLPFVAAGIWESPWTLRLARLTLAVLLAAFVALNAVAVLNFAEGCYLGGIMAPLR